MPARPTVRILRDRSGWHAQLGTGAQPLRARNLSGLFTQLRLLLDVATVRMVFDTGDAELDNLLAEVRAAWRRADQVSRAAQALADRLLARADGLPNRDVAVLIGKSHQRVAQLRQQYRARPSQDDGDEAGRCDECAPHDGTD
jgi:hypothetical protein